MKKLYSHSMCFLWALDGSHSWQLLWKEWYKWPPYNGIDFSLLTCTVNLLVASTASQSPKYTAPESWSLALDPHVILFQCQIQHTHTHKHPLPGLDSGIWVSSLASSPSSSEIIAPLLSFIVGLSSPSCSILLFWAKIWYGRDCGPQLGSFANS